MNHLIPEHLIGRVDWQPLRVRGFRICGVTQLGAFYTTVRIYPRHLEGEILESMTKFSLRRPVAALVRSNPRAERN